MQRPLILLGSVMNWPTRETQHAASLQWFSIV